MTDSTKPDPAAASTEWIEVGYVARPHGIRGELQLRPHWPGTEAFRAGEELELRLSGRVLRVRLDGLREVPKGYIATLKAVTGRDEADAWKGATCWALREPLEDGEYYLGDLVGATVYCDGVACGRVRSLAMYPTLDAMVVETPSGSVFEQPLLDEWVERVDAEAKEVYLKSLDGVIE